MRTMNIYACGGTGLNIARRFIRYIGENQPGFANIEPFFIDTSDTNVTPDMPQDRLYLVENDKGEKLRGSGKMPITNSALLKEATSKILHQFKPGDINVILHSAHGGSGTVIGRNLTRALLDRDIPTIVVAIGGTSSLTETQNTKKCLISYENMADIIQKPVIVSYSENTPDNPRAQVDKTVQTILVLISAIFSGQNRELDDMDLINFLNYSKPTGYQPRITQLDFFTGNVELGKNQSLISVVSLLGEGSVNPLTIPVEYLTEGYASENAKKTIGVNLPVHAATIGGFFNQVMDRLKRQEAEYMEIRSTVQLKSIASDSKVQADDDGMVY